MKLIPLKVSQNAINKANRMRGSELVTKSCAAYQALSEAGIDARVVGSYDFNVGGMYFDWHTDARILIRKFDERQTIEPQTIHFIVKES